MLAALRRKLNLEDLNGFTQHLHQTGAVIEGIFPLVWRVKPIPKEWHSRTRNELLALVLTCQRLGYTLPWPALKKIGNWLQVMPMIDDLDQMQVNIYYCLPNKLDPPIECIEIPKVDLDPYTLTDIESWCSYQRGKTILNYVKLRLASPLSTSRSPVRMRGRTNLDPYERIYRNICDIALHVDSVEETMQSMIGLVCRLRDTLDHYRFTFENNKELSDLIDQMKSFQLNGR